jgi:hypothetical protein
MPDQQQLSSQAFSVDLGPSFELLDSLANLLAQLNY